MSKGRIIKILVVVVALLFSLSYRFMPGLYEGTFLDQATLFDTMRMHGKIYIVVTLASIVLIGFLIFGSLLNSEVKKLERSGKDRQA